MEMKFKAARRVTSQGRWVGRTVGRCCAINDD